MPDAMTLTQAQTALDVWGLRVATRSELMTTNFPVRAYEGATHMGADWIGEKHAEVRNGWRARVAQYPGAFVVYDPDGDAEDWMLVGDDLAEIVAESVTHHEEINSESTPAPVTVKPTFTFNGHDAMTDEDVADALEAMATMVREGYTSGDAQGLGWWTVTGLTDAEDMPQDEEDGDDD
ncbi:hypothetical protein MARCHEWKA_01580 [Brevundimonas phage vB_BpoS-Marchewka]|uniref:Uncharacterized protein n=1 Tax=Brevundimonas phage vB_BpoS-Marchewka TaxID=2948604 RepID=A0A9E7SSE5_9CAUD|nr:hypothetical protein MARCHEWKA_01580 [Brevundimonas phage vB_BpoS-Marchewka]